MFTPREKNRVTVAFGVLNTNGLSLVPIKSGLLGGSLLISDGTSGPNLTGSDALRDENFETTLLAVSSVDGVTPVPIYVNASGALLTKST